MESIQNNENSTTYLNEVFRNLTNGNASRTMEMEDTFTRDASILIVIGLFITSVNALIILAFSTAKRLRRRSANIMIFSQACSDLFTGIVFVPAHLIETYQHTNHARGFLVCYMLFLSLFNLLALSTDRYMALSRPFLHHRILSVSRTVKLISFIWIIPLILTLIPLAWWFDLTKAAHAQKIYLSITWLFMLALVIAMTVLYSFVTYKARRTIKRKRHSTMGHNAESKMATLARKELRVIHLFGLLLFFFTATYLPILYMNFCDLIGYPEFIPQAVEIAGFYFLFLNSIVNPILCIYLKRDYFQVIVSILQCKAIEQRTWSFKSSGKETYVEVETTLLKQNSKRKIL
ncbi:adenosine receptor A3-like [Clytia hemisphaerica]|uniref:adenosine receptor A3-like n=1 Tax=Clytia hemisphaerica TaxID=252671 RepID=UPI0034D53303